MAKYQRIKCINVSKWKKELHINTSGTRNKYVITSKNGIKHYFKKSLQKPDKDYKYEFWSEVIASKVGQVLGFDVVNYDVAYFGNEIGCISESVIDTNEAELNEGYNLIVEKFPNFENNYKKTHSFQKIIGALVYLKIEHLTSKIIEMIIFDAIIGNSDRHSENWAVIVKNKLLQKSIDDYYKQPKIKRAISKVRFWLKYRGKYNHDKIINQLRQNNYFISPLYDNGSSLGRELSDDILNDLVSSENRLSIYIKKGKPDVRWNDKHLNHFDLIKVLNIDYQNEINIMINKIKANYDKERLFKLINSIDKGLPQQFYSYKIPSVRKDFIYRYIILRIDIIINGNEQI